MNKILQRIQAEKKRLRHEIRDRKTWLRKQERKLTFRAKLLNDAAFRRDYTTIYNELGRRKAALQSLIWVTRKA